jgi:hypothetical protein
VMQKKTGERVEAAGTLSCGRSIIGRRATRPTIGSSRGSLLDGHRLLRSVVQRRQCHVV